jgi:hypothetical protein
MKPLNTFPLDVDFNNMEFDGSVRLHLPAIVQQIDQMEIKLLVGARVWLTDGEIEVDAILEKRDGTWVARPCTKFRTVDLHAPYHIDYQSEESKE